MSRDLWIAIAGICIAGITLAWLLGSGGLDASAESRPEDAPSTRQAG